MSPFSWRCVADVSVEANLACEVKRRRRGRSQDISNSIDLLHEKDVV
jgi:hypothetical protein